MCTIIIWLKSIAKIKRYCFRSGIPFSLHKFKNCGIHLFDWIKWQSMERVEKWFNINVVYLMVHELSIYRLKTVIVNGKNRIFEWNGRSYFPLIFVQQQSNVTSISNFGQYFFDTVLVSISLSFLCNCSSMDRYFWFFIALFLSNFWNIS